MKFIITILAALVCCSVSAQTGTADTIYVYVPAEVGIADGGYVTVRFHELVPMTIDEIIHWVEGDSVGEKTWK